MIPVSDIQKIEKMRTIAYQLDNLDLDDDAEIIRAKIKDLQAGKSIISKRALMEKIFESEEIAELLKELNKDFQHDEQPLNLDRFNTVNHNGATHIMVQILVEIVKLNGGNIDRELLMRVAAKRMHCSITQMKLVLSVARGDKLLMIHPEDPAIIMLVEQ